MASHRGWSIEDGGTWLRARAWDPISRCYQSRSFPLGARNEARTWAADKHAEFRKDLDRIGPRGVAFSLIRARYLEELGVRGRSAQHIHDTGVILEHLEKVMPNAGDPEAERIAKRWFGSLSQSIATRNRYLIAAKAACAFAIEREMLGRSPFALVRALDPDEPLKEQFTIDELRALARAIDDPYHLRFSLLVYTGLRIKEAAGLRWEDIDWGGRVVAVRLRPGARVKRRRERLVPLQPELAAILGPHRKASGPVTISGMANLQREFSRFLARQKVVRKGLSPHSCRHTYAGTMTATGVASLLLASYLGHSSHATTAGYARLAGRFVHAVDGWRRGEFELLTGWMSERPRKKAA